MAVSYLSLLQQIRQQPDLIQRLGSGIGQFAQASIADSRERAKLEQANIQSMLSAGQTREAAQRVANLRQDLRTGYGMELPSGPVRGTPVMAPLQGPSVLPSMRSGMRPELATPEYFQRQVGESFENPETKRAVYAGAMLPQPKRNLIEVSGALYDPDAGTWVTSPAAMTPELRRQLQDERLKSQQEISQARIEAAAARGAAGAGGGSRERAPRLISTYDPVSGQMVVKEMRPGLAYAPAPFTGFAPSPENPDEVMPIVMPRVPVKPGTRPVAGPGRRPTQTDLTPAQNIQVRKAAEDAALKLFPEAGGNKEVLNVVLSTKPEIKAQYDAILEAETARARRAVVPSKGGKPAAAPEETSLQKLLRLEEEDRKRRQAAQKRK